MKGKKHDMPESKPAISKANNEVKVNEPPVKESINTVTDKPLKKETAPKPVQAGLPPLIVKSGNTDLRRGGKELGKVVQKMGMDPLNGALYAFSNEKNSVKVLQEKSDGTLLLMKKTNNPIEGWPKYKPSGEPGHTVEFSGKKRQQFLKNMGFPTNL